MQEQQKIWRFLKKIKLELPFDPAILLLGIYPEEGMATHSSILAWRIPWTEKPGGLQSQGRKELDMTEVT